MNIAHDINVNSKVANLPSRSLRYLDAGSGRACVLLHAFPMSADLWLPQLARVPQGWRFVAPDLRGFRGMGPAFEQPGLPGTTMDDYADDVVALMDHLDIDRAVVGGLSMGGYVAFALLRRAAPRVAGLVFADTRAGADSEDGRAGREAMRDVLRRDGPAGVARDMLPKLFGATTRRDQPELEDVVRGMITVNYAAAIDAGIVALRDRPDARPQLPAIAYPTLVVCGEEDVLTPMAESELMAAAIPGAALVRVPLSGHLSNLENAPAFNAALGGFLARL